MSRPKFSTRKDKTSHSEVRFWLSIHNCRVLGRGGSVPFYAGGFIKGYPIFAADVSNIGGWVDWLVWIGDPGYAVSCAWECKEEGKEETLTPGEAGWREYGPTLFSIVTTERDCERAALEAIEFLSR